MTYRPRRQHFIWLIGVFAVLATVTWLFEGNLTNDIVYGTGFGAALIAGIFWFFDLRHKAQQRRKADLERRKAAAATKNGAAHLDA